MHTLNKIVSHIAVLGRRISLVTFLKQYILSNNPTLYNMISDAYIERFIEKNNGEIVDILKKRYQPKKSIRIDCKKINTEEEFIRQFRKELNLSTLSGLNWMAMNDLYYDIIFPERLEFINWNDFEERMPQCAVQLKKFLKNNVFFPQTIDLQPSLRFIMRAYQRNTCSHLYTFRYSKP